MMQKKGLRGCDAQALKAITNNSAGIDATTVAQSQVFCIAAFDPGAVSGGVAFLFAAHPDRIASRLEPLFESLGEIAERAIRLLAEAQR